MIDDLKKLGDFEDANIKWTVSRFGESVSHNLKVYLMNGLPLANDSLRNIFGKDAMRLVLNSIENDTAYNNFIVYFISENKVGTMRMKTELPYSYKLEDFE